jgi:DNA-directed RNA polymerase subunit RPC12/RpoP
METSVQVDLVGEVRCVNCGRVLAELVRDPVSSRLRLRRAPQQSELLVRVVAGRVLRCQRCQGRAFVEQSEAVETTIAVRQSGSVGPLRGAA